MIVGVISSEHICQLESGIYDMTTQWYTWRFISNVVSSSWSQSTCMLRRCGRKHLWIVAIHTKRCALYVEHSSYLTNELVRSSNHPFVYFVPEHVNKYSIIRIIRRPVLWKDFAVYDLVVIPLRQRYCKLHVWLKLDLYVKDGSWVNLGISIGLDWFIWRPISTQVTEYPTTSGSWLLRHSERDME